MENNENQIIERYEVATSLLERTLALLEERLRAGEVEKISATVEQTGAKQSCRRSSLPPSAKSRNSRRGAAQSLLNPLRRTVPTSTSEMLAKHGIAEGPVDVRTLDAALAGLSLEQRIAVKSQLLRAGAIA